MDSFERKEIHRLLAALEFAQDKKLSSEEVSDLLSLFDTHLRRYLASEESRMKQKHGDEAHAGYREQHERILDELAGLHVLAFENRHIRVRDVFCKLAGWLNTTSSKVLASD